MRALLLVMVFVTRAVAEPAPSLAIGLQHQARYEYLSHDFRNDARGDSQGLGLRTLAGVEATFAGAFAGAELEDARTYASDATPLNTTLVNPLEILRAYAGLRATGWLSNNDTVDIRAGRITIDLGTRRLVARNRFRTTINGFTGVDATWTSTRKHVVRAFAAVPVTRLPADADGLADNAVELDEENTDALLWCGYVGSPVTALASQLELYLVGFHERDGDVASRDRQLYTLGARWYRKPAPGSVDFELEVMPQVGRSRATAAADDIEDLDHRALTAHGEIGVSPRIAGRPRLALEYDYASGDRDPGDGTTERFDPLFGARRFDFGPTGLYGPFNRSNLQGPGLRVTFAPTATLAAMVSYRLFWLASGRDAWVAAGVRDPSGESGRFVAEHVEALLRWTPLARNASVEAGAAYLRRGELAKSAPGTRQANPAYVYTQLTVEL